ncbi:MAG: hypothetical protein IKR76_10385 [Ruminococcus sp.]|nr:hypothetical protein [Ruminococcus sp.]
MKRLDILLIIAAAAVIILSKGRTPGITEQSIVHAIGIDKAEGGFSVTLQIFKPEAAGADTPVDISKANFKTLTATGRDMESCLYELSNKAGGGLFLGHLQLIVLGEGADFESAEQLFSPLRNDKSIYLGVYLACAENAGDIVSFPIKENAVTAENYRPIAENAAARGSTILARLIDIDTCLDECGSLAMPYLEINGKGESRSLDVAGSAILGTHGFYDCRLSDEECSALSLLLDTHTDLSLPKSTRISGRGIPLESVKSRISFSEQGGELICRISVKAAAYEQADIPQGLADDMTERLANTLKKYIKKYHTDPARLFEQLRLKKPALYAKYKGRLYELYDSMTIDVLVSIK